MNHDIQFERGAALYEASQYEEATRVLGPVVAADPTNDAAALMLSQCLITLGYAERGLDLANQVLSRDPDHLAGLILRARGLDMTGDSAGAAAAARRRTELAPNSSPVWADYSLFARGPEDSVKDRIAAAQRAVHLDPQSAYAHYALGCAQSEVHPLRAATSFKAALAIDPQSSGAQLMLAKVQSGIGRIGPALDTVLRLVKETPGDPVLRFWVGVITSRSVAWFASLVGVVVFAVVRLGIHPMFGSESWSRWLAVVPAVLLVAGVVYLGRRFGRLSLPTLRLARIHRPVAFVALWMVLAGTAIFALGAMPGCLTVAALVGGGTVMLASVMIWFENLR